jgi:hypothetical protein
LVSIGEDDAGESSVVRSTGRVANESPERPAGSVGILLLLRNTDDFPKSPLGTGNAVTENRRCHPRKIVGATPDNVPLAVAQRDRPTPAR